MSADRRILKRFDWTLFSIVMLIGGIGLVTVLSASYVPSAKRIDPLVIRQLIWLAIGVALMLGAVLFDYRSLITYSYPFYFVTLLLLVAVEFVGHSTGGSRRWIDLGLFRLEPSELAKIAIVFVMVRYFREEPPPGGWGFRHLLVPLVMLAVPTVLVLKQPDLGSAMILVLLTGTLLVAGGLNWRVLALLLVAAMLAAPLSWHHLKPYQKARMESFIDPQADPLGTGYHIIQSEIAIGAGGSWGKGYMKGTQARLNFLPEETTDFIFAVYAEEFGLAGCLLLLGLYASLLARGISIARHARDRFGSLLAVGLTGIIFWQVAINMMMTTGMLPVVGIPLPLVSYGGSSMLTTMGAMGILISINARRYTF